MLSQWGSIESNGNLIADYASKQWGGLVGSYHLPLWQHFFARMFAQVAFPRPIPPSFPVLARAFLWRSNVAC